MFNVDLPPTSARGDGCLSIVSTVVGTYSIVLVYKNYTLLLQEQDSQMDGRSIMVFDAALISDCLL
jgi:hypothetical protein